LPTVHAQTLRRAAQVLGGTEQLARHLAVKPSQLALWMGDAEPTPPDIFLKAVDLLAEHDDPGKRPN
jgi:DNA-binding transcriptional regulator YdaS (Cro superfamily)